ncbi:glutamate--tRNA ligase [Malassezia pachydermatis]
MSNVAIVLDPSARLPFFTPLVLSNLAVEHAAAPAEVTFEPGADTSLTLDGQTIRGHLAVLQALAKHYASTGITGAEVEPFLVQADALASAAFPVAMQNADDLDQHLALRTYLVGHSVTAADAAIWGAIRSSSPLLGIIKKQAHTHLARWYAHVDALPAFSSAVATLTEAKSQMFKQKKTAAGFDLFLKGAKEGQVVTRFPPEASGYLHVGHAKAAILNQYFAKMYKGRLLIRFDDTNPSKEKQEYEDAIIEDLALLGIQGDQLTHTSDYFEQLRDLAKKMIQEGKAYADDTPQEQMRAERMDGIASQRRDASPEENMKRFEEMLAGTKERCKWCLRAKMSVDNPNKAMRDPVIYRCNVDMPHQRTGTQWKAYPTYDFACPVVDSLEGVTHALRTNEYHDRNTQYAWILNALGMRQVEIWDYGRLNFVYTLLSKRKLQWFVDHGAVTGWDDPRFPTVRGIRRRGMTIECIQQFILSQGPSQQITNMEWDNIWALNKRILDPIVPRFVALDEAKIVKATIRPAPPAEEKQVPRHKKNADLGMKTTVYDSVILLEQADAASFEDNEEITLMDWGNVIVRGKTVENGVVTALDLEAHFDGDFKTTKKKVTWLAQPNEKRHLTEVRLLDFDYLITKKKLEEDDKFQDFLTPQTRFETLAVADANVATLRKGDQIQFERKGYYILDNEQGADGRREFIKIPDGRAATSASKAAPDENPEQKKAAAAAARAQKAAEKAQKKAQKGGGAAPPVPPKDGVSSLVAEGTQKINMYQAPIINKPTDTPVNSTSAHRD